MKHVPSPYEGEFFNKWLRKTLDAMTNKNSGDNNNGSK